MSDIVYSVITSDIIKSYDCNEFIFNRNCISVPWEATVGVVK